MNPNDPAFPISNKEELAGLTKRELLAAMAMQGILTGNKLCYSYERSPAKNGHDLFIVQPIAMAAVEYADALIKELSKE